MSNPKFHLSLDLKDLAGSSRFFRALFGTAPRPETVAAAASAGACCVEQVALNAAAQARNEQPQSCCGK